MTELELYHHGILGQKWGVRRYQNKDGSLTSSGKKRYDAINLAKEKYKDAKKTADDAYTKAGEKWDATTKRGTIQNKKADNDFNKASDNWAADRKAAKKEYKDTKSKIKKEIKDTTKKLNDNATVVEKLVYNNATRKLAAKYIVNNNMSVAEATKKAKGVALRNTVAFTSAFGAITLANLYKMNH